MILFESITFVTKKCNRFYFKNWESGSISTKAVQDKCNISHVVILNFLVAMPKPRENTSHRAFTPGANSSFESWCPAVMTCDRRENAAPESQGVARNSASRRPGWGDAGIGEGRKARPQAVSTAC